MCRAGWARASVRLRAWLTALPGAEIDGTVEEKIINEEYKIWKKNTPFLCANCAACRPSRAQLRPCDDTRAGVAQPHRAVAAGHLQARCAAVIHARHMCCRPEGKDYTVQRVILGTHTCAGNARLSPHPLGRRDGGEHNHLVIASVQLPSDDARTENRKYDDDKGGREPVVVHDAHGCRRARGLRRRAGQDRDHHANSARGRGQPVRRTPPVPPLTPSALATCRKTRA